MPLPSEMEQRVLEDLTPEEAALVQKGLDLIVRVHLGQVDVAFEPLILHLGFGAHRAQTRMPDDGGYRWPHTGLEAHLVTDALREVGTFITGVRTGGPGIGNPLVSPEGRRAYKLLCRLRGDRLGETLFDDVDAAPVAASGAGVGEKGQVVARDHERQEVGRGATHEG